MLLVHALVDLSSSGAVGAAAGGAVTAPIQRQQREDAHRVAPWGYERALRLEAERRADGSRLHGPKDQLPAGHRLARTDAVCLVGAFST
jgi:hypothetical protein